MDSFIEYMIKQKKTGSAIARQILIIAAALLVILAVTFVFLILPPEFISFWPLCVAAVIFAAYKFICRFDVEFEYILTNGELDVDRITNRKKRKRLITIHAKSFTEFGKVKGAPSDKGAGYARVIDASAHSDSFEDYYAVFFKNGQKIKLIFNPTSKMIDVFRIYAPRVVGEI